MNDKGFDRTHELPADLSGALRADALRKAERSEEFWGGQRARIRARVRARTVFRPQPLRIAIVGAVILFVAVLLTAPAGRPPQVVSQVPAVDADQQLLVAVEHALASGTPEALEPLTLLVESNSNFNEVEGISHKERRNED